MPGATSKVTRSRFFHTGVPFLLFLLLCREKREPRDDARKMQGPGNLANGVNQRDDGLLKSYKAQ
jgi:hypothetical protein